MNKKAVLSFILGACLGSGITWYFIKNDQSSAVVSTSRASTANQIEAQKPQTLPVGQGVSLGESSGNEIDNSERSPESPQESRTQMEAFERSIAGEDESLLTSPEEQTLIPSDEVPEETASEEAENQLE